MAERNKVLSRWALEEGINAAPLEEGETSARAWIKC